MKKAYQTPYTHETLIALGGRLLQNSSPNATLTSKRTVDAEAIESRRHTFWDDDEGCE